MTMSEIVLHRNVDNWIQLLTYVSSRTVKTVRTNIFENIASFACCINLQLPIVILKKSIISVMRNRKTYMYTNF